MIATLLLCCSVYLLSLLLLLAPMQRKSTAESRSDAIQQVGFALATCYRLASG